MSVVLSSRAYTEEASTDLVVHAQWMLDPATPEPLQRRAELRLLAWLPILQALGVFEWFAIRNPALQALVRDELATRKLPARPPAPARPLLRQSCPHIYLP